jgi:hypothetical protein
LTDYKRKSGLLDHSGRQHEPVAPHTSADPAETITELVKTPKTAIQLKRCHSPKWEIYEEK